MVEVPSQLGEGARPGRSSADGGELDLTRAAEEWLEIGSA
jgi:hypothetical protein